MNKALFPPPSRWATTEHSLHGATNAYLFVLYLVGLLTYVTALAKIIYCLEGLLLVITKTKDREVTTKEITFKRVFGGTHQNVPFNHVKKK